MSKTFIRITGVVQDGRLTLPDAQKGLEESFISSMSSGTIIEKTIRKLSPHKTHKQVKTIFGLVMSRIIEEFDNNGWDSSMLLNLPKPTGVGVSKNLLKEYLYIVCPMTDEEGNRITLGNASIEQAMKFIDDSRNFASSQWGIYVPDPDPLWKEKRSS